MALNKQTLQVAIVSMLNELKTQEDQVQAIDTFADQLSTAIDSYIKTATVTTVVATPAGAGTGKGNLS